MLRCKFQVQEISRTGSNRRLKLCAVTGEENKPWSKYTPSGSFKIYIDNPGIFDQIDRMNPGDPYFIDLAPAKEPAALQI